MTDSPSSRHRREQVRRTGLWIGELDHGELTDPPLHGVAETVPSESRCDQVSPDAHNSSTRDNTFAPDPRYKHTVEGDRFSLTCKRHDVGRRGSDFEDHAVAKVRRCTLTLIVCDIVFSINA